MTDPEIKELIDKAEQLNLMGDRLLEQGRKLKEQADKLIAESKGFLGKPKRKLP